MPRIHPDVKLTDDRNECPTCGALFETSDAFDAHLVGRFAVGSQESTRRCLTAAEMHQAGFRANRHGFLLSEVEHKYDPRKIVVRSQSQSALGTENAGA
jgi:hypothetical protein